MKGRQVLIFLTALFLSLPIHGQQEFHPVLTITQGLPQNSISHIVQDETGFLWIATQGGLTRWSGTTVQNYPRRRLDNFSPGYIQMLKKDENGRIWMIPPDGKIYYWNPSGQRFESAGLDRENINGSIHNLFSLPQVDKYLISTTEGSIYSFGHDDPGTLLLQQQDNPVWDFHYMDGEILLGTERGWLCLNHTSEGSPPWEWTDECNFRGNNYQQMPVLDIYHYQNTLAAARGKEGLTLYDLKEQVSPRHISQFNANKILGVNDDQIIIWNGSDKLITLSLISYSVVEEVNLPQSATDVHMVDNRHFFFGTSSEGLWHNNPYALDISRWPKPNWSAGNTEGSIPSKNIMSLLEENDGYWLFSYDGGIMFYHPLSDQLEFYNTSLGNSVSDRLKFALKDSRGTLWAASYDRGLLYFNRTQERWQQAQLPDPWQNVFQDLRINHIMEDHRGLLWISTGSGMYIYNPHLNYITSFFQMTHIDDLNGFCWASVEGRRNEIWITTGESTYLYQDQELTQVETKKDLNWFILSDSRGLIFTGSSSGIEIFENSGERLYLPKLENALEGLAVYSMLEHSDGLYWITTNNGLYWWDMEKGHISKYNGQSGSINREINLYSMAQLEGGAVYIGGSDGVDFIDGSQIGIQEGAPNFIIERIEINHRDIRELFNDIDINSLKELNLDFGENFISLTLQEINLHNEIMSFEYRMAGLNDQWIDLGEQRKISFINLPPGRYTLEVKVRNGAGEYSDARSMDILISAPFYKSFWFFLIILSLSGAVVALFTRYILRLNNEIRLRTLAEKRFAELNSSLEEQVIGRTRELQKTLEQLQKTQEQMIQQEKMSSLGRVVAGIAHEINSPLGAALLSSSYVDELIQQTKESFQSGELTKEQLEDFINELESSIKNINVNLDRSAGLVSSFKKVAIEKNTRDIIHFDLSASIRTLLHSLSSQLNRNGIKVISHIPAQFEITSCPGDISQVISNILMNCIIHAFRSPFDKPEKIISLALTYTKSEFTLRIRDNGVGISQEALTHIYDPFYVSHRESGGAGLGLNMVYLVVKKKLKGNISVNSQLEKGTEQVIRLPLFLNE